MIITRKIEVVIDENDPIKRKEFSQTIRKWRDSVRKAANIAISHKCVQKNLAEYKYLTDEMVEKVTVPDIIKKGPGLSVQNVTNRVMVELFGNDVPSAILSCLNQNVSKSFTEDYPLVKRGERSVRTYKNDIPIPFPAKSLRRFEYDKVSKSFTFILHKIPFKTILGRDYSNNSTLLKRCIDETNDQYDIRSSSLKIETNGKIFLLASIQIPSQRVHQKDKTLYAYLSVNTPILCSTNPEDLEAMSMSGLYEHRQNMMDIAKQMESLDKEIGKTTRLLIEDNYNENGGKSKSSHIISIGSKEEYLHRRIQIQCAVRRCQVNNRYAKGGKGRKRKCQAIERWHKIEMNYIQTKLHTYARILVNEARKQECSRIVLCNQQWQETQAKNMARKGDYYLLRNWSFYGLKEKIIYKAALLGIDVAVEEEPKALIVYFDDDNFKYVKNFSKAIGGKYYKYVSEDQKVYNMENYGIVYLGLSNKDQDLHHLTESFVINNINEDKIIIPFTTTEKGDILRAIERMKAIFPSIVLQEGIKLSQLSDKDMRAIGKKYSTLLKAY